MGVMVQKELFPKSQVVKPRSCRECVRFYEDPYPRCMMHPNRYNEVSHICRHFAFADEQSTVLIKNKSSVSNFNNK